MLLAAAFVFGFSSFHFQDQRTAIRQSDSCQFTLIIADSLLNKEVAINRFAVSGVGKKLALQFRTDLNLQVGKEVVVLDEAFFRKIRSQTCGKKYTLKQVRVVDEALLESPAVFIVFSLKKGR